MNIDKPIKWSIWTFVAAAGVSLFVYMYNERGFWLSWPATLMGWERFLIQQLQNLLLIVWVLGLLQEHEPASNKCTRFFP